MRLLVCGGRDFDRGDLVQRALRLLRPTLVMHGAARGADMLAGLAAHALRIPVEPYYADWKQHGRRAGPIRNAEMLREGRPDAVLAFPGGRGTADMIKKAVAAGVPVWEVKP